MGWRNNIPASGPQLTEMIRRHWWRLIPLAITVFFAWGTVDLVHEALTNTTGGKVPIYAGHGLSRDETGYYEDVGPAEYRRESWVGAVIMGLFTCIAAVFIWHRPAKKVDHGDSGLCERLFYDWLGEHPFTESLSGIVGARATSKETWRMFEADPKFKAAYLQCFESQEWPAPANILRGETDDPDAKADADLLNLKFAAWIQEHPIAEERRTKGWDEASSNELRKLLAADPRCEAAYLRGIAREEWTDHAGFLPDEEGAPDVETDTLQ